MKRLTFFQETTFKYIYSVPSRKLCGICSWGHGTSVYTYFIKRNKNIYSAVYGVYNPIIEGFILTTLNKELLSTIGRTIPKSVALKIDLRSLVRPIKYPKQYKPMSEPELVYDPFIFRLDA